MVSTPDDSQAPLQVTDTCEKGTTSDAKTSALRYATAGLVLVATWALTVLSFIFDVGVLALPLFFVAVVGVTCLLAPSGGPNSVANHGGIGLLAGVAALGPLLLLKGGIIFAGVGAIAGGFIGMFVGACRSDTSLP